MYQKDDHFFGDVSDEVLRMILWMEEPRRYHPKQVDDLTRDLREFRSFFSDHVLSQLLTFATVSVAKPEQRVSTEVLFQIVKDTQTPKDATRVQMIVREGLSGYLRGLLSAIERIERGRLVCSEENLERLVRFWGMLKLYFRIESVIVYYDLSSPHEGAQFDKPEHLVKSLRLLPGKDFRMVFVLSDRRSVSPEDLHGFQGDSEPILSHSNN